MKKTAYLFKADNESIPFHILELIYAQKGPSKYKKDQPDLFIDTSPIVGQKSPFYGEYDYGENSITLYSDKVTSFQKLCKTLLHEYEHYLQSSTWYYRYDTSIGYKNNPYEIQALNAEKDWSIFLENSKVCGFSSKERDSSKYLLTIYSIAIQNLDKRCTCEESNTYIFFDWLRLVGGGWSDLHVCKQCNNPKTIIGW